MSLLGLRVLVVDDDVDSRELLSIILEMEGAEVFATSSTNQALSWLQQHRFDVLLSDLSMPETDGFGFIELVRTREDCEGKQIPAVAVTAMAERRMQQKALQSGFQWYIAKPFLPEQLIEAIASLGKPRLEEQNPVSIAQI